MGCIGIDGERISEPVVYGGSGRCAKMYPVHGNPRVAAGATISGEPLKCGAKAIQPVGLYATLTSDQVGRLKTTFSTGCVTTLSLELASA